MRPSSNITPIVLFVYNRPWHTRQTVEALQKNELAGQSDLIIYSDGSPNEKAQVGVREVREYIKTITGFNRIEIIERKRNLGLANSIIAGVTDVVDNYGWVIVMEDDLVSSPFLLRYMNAALNYYENDERIASIGAYTFPVKSKLPEAFFLRYASSWGWATWKRGWDIFNCNGEKLLAELNEKGLYKRFDFDGAYPYTKMLKEQINGNNDSWAIRWYASAFLAEKLTLYPGKSLVNNIGHDCSGSHCGIENRFDVTVSEHPIIMATIKNIDVIENADAFHEISQFLKRNIVVRIISRIKRTIKS